MSCKFETYEAYCTIENIKGGGAKELAMINTRKY